MTKEVLEYLLNDEPELFKQGLISFFKQSISFDDLHKYSFMPSFMQGWLFSSINKFHFDLHIIYQRGILVNDIQTFVLIPKKGDKAYVITLHNSGQRDSDAKNEIVKLYTQKSNPVTNTNAENIGMALRNGRILPPKVQASNSGTNINAENPGHVLRSGRVLPPTYEEILDKHFEMLVTTFLVDPNVTEDKKVNLAADAAWVLANEITNEALAGKLKAKKIQYIGIANLNNHIAVTTKQPRFIKPDIASSDIKRLRKEIIDSLYIKRIGISKKKINLDELEIDKTAQSKFTMTDLLKKIETDLETLLERHHEILGTKSLYPEFKSKFLEANLHAFYASCVFSHRRGLGDIAILSNAEAGTGRCDLALFFKREVDNPQGVIIEFKVGKTTALKQMATEGLDQATNRKYYKIFQQFYNVKEFMYSSMAASNSGAKISTITTKAEKIEKPKKEAFSKLLADGDFAKFKINLKNFFYTVVSTHDVNKKNPGFIPSLLLGFLIDGTARGEMTIYTCKQTYNNFGFLIASHEDRLILLTNEKKSHDSNMIKYYKKDISDIAGNKRINTLDIVSIEVYTDENSRNINIEHSTMRINDIKTIDTTSTRSKIITTFNRNDFKGLSFKKIIGMIIRTKEFEVNIENIKNKFETQIQNTIFNTHKLIFTSAKLEDYYHGQLLAFFGQYWKYFDSLRSNAESGYGRSDIIAIPKQMAIRSENLPEIDNSVKRAIVIEVKATTKSTNSQNDRLAESGREQINRMGYTSTIGMATSYFESCAVISVAFSEGKVSSHFSEGVVPHETPYKVDYTFSDSEGDSPLKPLSPQKRRGGENLSLTKRIKSNDPRSQNNKGCRSRRAINSPACVSNAMKQEFEKAFKDILSWTDDEISTLDTLRNKIYQSLLEKNIPDQILNALKLKIDVTSDLIVKEFLYAHDSYLMGDSPEAVALRKQKSKIKLRLNTWVSFVVLIYGVFDISTVLYNFNGKSAPIFELNDMFESMSSFLSERFSQYTRTRPIGSFFKKLANNPITKSLGYIGCVLQVSLSSIALLTGNGQAVDGYWLGRGVQQLLSSFFKVIGRSSSIFAVIDVLISILSHIKSSKEQVLIFEGIIPLTQDQKDEIFYKSLFFKDLTKYIDQINIKQTLIPIFQGLKNYLKKTPAAAVVYYGDTVFKHRVYKAKVLPKFNRRVELFPECMKDEQNPTYSFVPGSTHNNTIDNLADFSINTFLNTSIIYLGDRSVTAECLSYYSFMCNASPRDHILRATRYHAFEAGQMKQDCRNIDAEKFPGSWCEKEQQIRVDEEKRTQVQVVGASPEIPTLTLAESQHFKFSSIPSGEMIKTDSKCKPIAPLHTGGICNYEAIVDECTDTFSFQNPYPFILTDLTKNITTPSDAPVLYINAPSKRKVNQNETVTTLVAIPSNPAYIIFNSGENYFNITGSQLENHFALNSRKTPEGYLLASKNENDILENLNPDVEFKAILTTDATDLPGWHPLVARDFEFFLGTNNGTESLLINSCKVRYIDGKGANDGEGANSKGDLIEVNEKLKCGPLDTEYREVNPNDLQYMHAAKKTVFQVRPEEISAGPAYIIQTTPAKFPQIVQIDLPFSQLKIARFEDNVIIKNAYKITTLEDKVLLISNGYDNVFYYSLDGWIFLIEKMTLTELTQLINQYELCKDSDRYITDISSCDDITKQILEDIRVTVHKEYTNNQTLSALLDELKLFDNVKRITVENPKEKWVAEVGSPLNDDFTTRKSGFTYFSKGCGGRDLHIILPTESQDPVKERVIIDSKNCGKNGVNGQSVLDIRSFEDLNPQITMEEINAAERENFNLGPEAIKLWVQYENPLLGKSNFLAFFLEGYSYPDVALTDTSAGVIHKIDTVKKQLVPVYFPDNYSSKNSSILYPLISLDGGEVTFIAPLNPNAIRSNKLTLKACTSLEISHVYEGPAVREGACQVNQKNNLPLIEVHNLYNTKIPIKFPFPLVNSDIQRVEQTNNIVIKKNGREVILALKDESDPNNGLIDEYDIYDIILQEKFLLSDPIFSNIKLALTDGRLIFNLGKGIIPESISDQCKVDKIVCVQWFAGIVLEYKENYRVIYNDEIVSQDGSIRLKPNLAAGDFFIQGADDANQKRSFLITIYSQDPPITYKVMGNKIKVHERPAVHSKNPPAVHSQNHRLYHEIPQPQESAINTQSENSYVSSLFWPAVAIGGAFLVARGAGIVYRIVRPPLQANSPVSGVAVTAALLADGVQAVVSNIKSTMDPFSFSAVEPPPAPSNDTPPVLFESNSANQQPQLDTNEKCLQLAQEFQPIDAFLLYQVLFKKKLRVTFKDSEDASWFIAQQQQQIESKVYDLVERCLTELIGKCVSQIAAHVIANPTRAITCREVAESLARHITTMGFEGYLKRSTTPKRIIDKIALRLEVSNLSQAIEKCLTETKCYADGASQSDILMDDIVQEFKNSAHANDLRALLVDLFCPEVQKEIKNKEFSISPAMKQIINRTHREVVPAIESCAEKYRGEGSPTNERTVGFTQPAKSFLSFCCSSLFRCASNTLKVFSAGTPNIICKK